MKLPTLTELVKGTASFARYQDGVLYYAVTWTDGQTSRIIEIPIPVDDAGGGEFLPQDKGITFQRWIRKHLEYLKKSMEDEGR